MKIESILNLIYKNILRHSRYNRSSIDEFILKTTNRDVYVGGKVYKEYTYEFVFEINTGDWFSKTIRFDVSLNSCDWLIKYRKGYGEDFVLYERHKYLDVVNKILHEVLKFSYSDRKKELNFKIEEKIV